jgi:hypothetical protein
VIEGLLNGRTGGRHALDEDAVQTPIFAALSRGEWQQRQQERTGSSSGSSSGSSLDDFRRDPLTAPLPVQLAGVVTPPGQDAGTDLARRRAARERAGSSGPRGVTGALIADMTMCAPADPGRRRSSAASRTRAARELSAAPRDWSAGERSAAQRERHGGERSATRPEWAGLDALADTGRHHLRPVANW